MTREEAIYRLKNMAWLYGSAEREQNIEAIDMAIEALQSTTSQERVNYESTNDLISRADVINEIQRYERHFNTKLESLYVLINELPSAELINGDLISRADAKQAIRDRFKDLATRVEINTVLNEVPSADAVSREMREPTEEERASVKRYIDSISADVVSVVRCKDCDNRHTDDCPMHHEEWYEIDEGNGFVDNDFTVHDYPKDDGFCSWAKMKGGAE